MQANKPPKGKRKNIIKELFCVNNKFDYNNVCVSS